MVASPLGQSEVDYIKAGCLEDCRVDGRSCREFRHHNVLVSSSSSSSLLVRSNGSSRILVEGGTHVLCSVKADIVAPSIHRPNHGSIELSVEHHPHATGSNSSKKSRNDGDVLQQLLEDLFLPHLMDWSALCLVRGEFAWRLSIDVLVLSCGNGGSSSSSASSTCGALLDAASLAVSAALQSTWLPAVTVVPKDDESSHPPKVGSGDAFGSSHLGLRSNDATNTAELIVEGDMAKARRVFDWTVDDNQTPTTTKGRPVDDEVHLITVTIVKCYATSPTANEPSTPKFVCLLDATPDEVACSHCQIHVAVKTPQSFSVDPKSSSSGESTVCALQTSGGGSIHLSLISEATRIALQAAVERRKFVETTDLALLNNPAASSSIDGGGGTAPRRTGDDTMLLQELYALQ